MIDLESSLRSLARLRPLFHSEADFQHALAWHVQSDYPGAAVRLEVPASPLRDRSHVDVRISEGRDNLVLELKYKTRDFEGTIGDERFRLKGQSAQDIGRYDFLKDVERLERVVQANAGWLGFAILLTNDSSYWKHPRTPDSVDAAFRLQDGRTVEGTLAWSPRAGRGTIDKREGLLALQGTYPLHWRDYSDLRGGGYSVFKYLLLRIGSDGEHA